MKHIAIIGAGLAGLRAGVELCLSQQVSLTFFEKSPSVGGRVATRRLGDVHVNHGADSFKELIQRSHDDLIIESALMGVQEGGPVTLLAKNLRNHITASSETGRTFNFFTRVKRIVHEKTIELEDGTTQDFDYIIVTSPMPQTAEMLLGHLLPQAEYKKELLLIGERSGKAIRKPLKEEFIEKNFELPEDEIHALLKASGEDVEGLFVKKWRYAEVTKGLSTFYEKVGDNIILAGDAFDPEGKYGIAAAWFSGRAAGRDLIR